MDNITFHNHNILVVEYPLKYSTERLLITVNKSESTLDKRIGTRDYMEEILYRRPQILLLGNGLNLAFGDSPTSWKNLLEELTVDKYKGKINPDLLPNTLQIILRTDGEVNSSLKNFKNELEGNPITDDLSQRINRILEIRPDHILTTNYSYEIEAASVGKKTLSDNAIFKMQKHTSEVEICEPQYMIHIMKLMEYRYGIYIGRLVNMSQLLSAIIGMVL